MSQKIKKIITLLLIASIAIKAEENEETEETTSDDLSLDYFSPGFFFIYKNKKNCVKNEDGNWELDIASFWVNGYNPATFSGEWNFDTGVATGTMKLVDVKTVTLLISDKNWAGIWRGGHLKIDNFTEAVLLSAKFKEDTLHTFNLTSKNMDCPLALDRSVSLNKGNAVKKARRTAFISNYNVRGNNSVKINGGLNEDLKLCAAVFDLNDHAQFNIEGVTLRIGGFYSDTTNEHNVGEAIGGYYGMLLFKTGGEFLNKKYRMNFWQDNFSVDLYYYLQWQTIPWYYSWWMVTIYVIVLLLIITGVIVCICTCGKSSGAE
eukprot:GAHX01001752.1.p1 GENE.GAHX01001752.1~~GAHX01001752.1.p1  ORF type:complete len:319 (+),score=55.79 GAHX01001752.1:334-1290(+)